MLYNAGSGAFADVETITPNQFEQAMKAKGAGDIVFIGLPRRAGAAR